MKRFSTEYGICKGFWAQNDKKLKVNWVCNTTQNVNTASVFLAMCSEWPLELSFKLTEEREEFLTLAISFPNDDKASFALR